MGPPLWFYLDVSVDIEGKEARNVLSNVSIGPVVYQLERLDRDDRPALDGHQVWLVHRKTGVGNGHA